MEIIQSSKTNSVNSDFPKKREINYQKLVLDLLLLLRGSLTQRELSQKMGYSFNQVGKWESGVTRIKWQEFLIFCEVINPKILILSANLFSVIKREDNSLAYAKAVLQSMETLLNFSGANLLNDKRQIKRWKNKTSQPRLEEVLAIVDSRPYILTGWLSQFVDCKQIASLKEEYHKFESALYVVGKEPLSGFVNAALQLQEYLDLTIHSNEILLDHVTCSESELNRVLKLLHTNKLIEFVGEKYIPKFENLSFSLLPNITIRPLYQYVHNFINARFKIMPANNYPESNKKTMNFSMASVRIAPLSKEASKKAADLVSRFHQEMGKVVEEDSGPKTNVQVILIHSVPSTINS